MVTANNVVGGVYTGWSRMDLARRFRVFVNAYLASCMRSAATQSEQSVKQFAMRKVAADPVRVSCCGPKIKEGRLFLNDFRKSLDF